MHKFRLRLPDPLAETPPFFGRADARIGCGCGRARGLGYGGYVVSAARRQGTARRCAARWGYEGLPGNLGRNKSRRALWGALVALCAAVALRGRARPPPGTIVPVWRLRALRRAWAAAACPSAHCSLRCLSGAGRAAAIGTARVGGLRYSACHRARIQSRKWVVSVIKPKTLSVGLGVQASTRH